MYYSNITNETLQYFHNLKVDNFTIKLSEVLSSDLFKIEVILTDKLYRIYPLFYCNEIISSNSDDKVLDAKCVICNQTTSETYLTFKSDDGSIKDYCNYVSYYDIGDTLTTNDYNTIVSLLRKSIIHNDSIKINEEADGDYGTYLFDVDGSTILDKGILITDETITAQPQVKLVNPVFEYSTYTLNLQVIHFTDTNILDDVTDDFTVSQTLEIELPPDTWVDIPLASLGDGYIIIFDANVEITHDKPIIIEG